MLVKNVCFFNVKCLKSKKGNDFYLATFAYEGEPFKCIVSDTLADTLRDLLPGQFLSLDCGLSVYNDHLSLSVKDILID